MIYPKGVSLIPAVFSGHNGIPEGCFRLAANNRQSVGLRLGYRNGSQMSIDSVLKGKKNSHKMC